MLHDILITVGVYALLGLEVSVATVAAVLTVLGYSIYDTIIIFDRVRENIPLMRRQPFATIVNVSLWETIRRSLATTFITLLPIICLEIFGGATLKDFAFALGVGVALRCVLVDLHRGAAAHDLEGARAGVREAAGADARRARRPRSSSRSRRSPPSRRPSSSTSPGRRRRSRRPWHAARSAGSAAARGRMAARGSERIAEIVEELLVEFPARAARRAHDGCPSRRSARCASLVDELNLVTRDEFDELELRVAQLEHRLGCSNELPAAPAAGIARRAAARRRPRAGAPPASRAR